MVNSTTHSNQRNRLHKEMPFPWSELPLELQDLIIKHVHQLEELECDQQHEIVAQLDGLLEDVVLCLGAQNNTGMIHWVLDVWDVDGHDWDPSTSALRSSAPSGTSLQTTTTTVLLWVWASRMLSRWLLRWPATGSVCRLKQDSAPTPFWLRINLALRLLASVCVSSARVRLHSLQCCSSHELYISLAV